MNYKNYTGCGNTFNCNHEPVMNLVLDSLRHWVDEYHVDGFRFDLTSCLCRDPNSGAIMTSPPVVRAIAKDNTLSRCKLFAEPWDCSMDGYLVGKFPNWDRWGEWNGIYRDTVRRFLKGDPGLKSQFALPLRQRRYVQRQRAQVVSLPQLHHRARRVHAEGPRVVQQEAEPPERGGG